MEYKKRYRKSKKDTVGQRKKPNQKVKCLISNTDSRSKRRKNNHSKITGSKEDPNQYVRMQSIRITTTTTNQNKKRKTHVL